MAYQALYRKWRPASFDDVKGQDHIVKTLKNQISLNRIGHAYLFCGTRGTGKTTVAKIFAKAVNCEHPVDGSPCGECAACRAIASGASMNVIEIDAASNNGVDNIREIRDEVQYSPTEGKYKVYIIDEVHMLSDAAFNALLKTLEEPPEYVIFILATTEVHKIPITILSRCQRYDFHRISIDTIADRLSELMKAEGVSVEEKAIRYISKVADGSMRDALSLIDQCIAFYLGQELKYENVLEVLGAVDTAVFEELYENILSHDTTGCMHTVEDIVMQGRDIDQFTDDFVWYLRNLLLVRTTKDRKSLEDIIDVSADNLEQLAICAKKADEGTIMRLIRIMSELSGTIKFSTQKRIKFEVTLIKLCHPVMDQSGDTSELMGRLSDLEKRFDELSDDIKKGNVAIAGSDPIQNSKVAPVKQTVPKRVVEALPEDIEEIARQWKDMIISLESGLIKTYLEQCNVTLAQDGHSLELVTSSKTAYGTFSGEEGIAQLKSIIEERTGLDVDIVVTKLDEGEDFKNRFTDIIEVVNMKIEVDDKEEFI